MATYKSYILGCLSLTFKRKKILRLMILLVVILSVYLLVDYILAPPCDNLYRVNPLTFLAFWRRPESGLFEKYDYYDENKLKRKKIFKEMKNIKQNATNIFFIESTCGTHKIAKDYNNEKKFILNARQSCAVESTALNNPHNNVYIMYTCPLSEDFIQHLSAFATHLLDYPNVRVVRTNLTELFMGTPLQHLYQSKQLEFSDFPVEHGSDVIRAGLLWKFGGTYLDLDVVTIKPLKKLKTNFVGIQDQRLINAAVMNVEPSGPGHRVLGRILEQITTHFNSTEWTANGPQVLTTAILDECQATEINEAVFKCKTFNVYDYQLFYLVHYTEVELMFDPELGRTITDHLKRLAFVVHLWNKLSWKLRVPTGSAYALLAMEFCPNVYRNCHQQF